MTDLISRQAAIDATCHNCSQNGICDGKCDDTDRLRDLPTIDAVPVVRCKDCKHNSLNRFSGNALCDLGMGLFHPYDFCSQAEERSEE